MLGRTRRRRRDAEPIADPEACREAALKLLERQRRTRADLERRLRDKGYALATVIGVLDRLAGVGLVDDAEYARAYLAGRWGRRAAGWRRLEQELRGRGVSADDIARGRALLEERSGAMDEAGGARRVLEQVARRYQRLDPRVRRQRLTALLLRRGFDLDTVREALNAEDEEREEA
jgi:regulatory protein